MIKGLRLTETRCDGFNHQFSRWQLSEHRLIPGPGGEVVWCRGKIIHHFNYFGLAKTYFNELGKTRRYVDASLVLAGEAEKPDEQTMRI